MGSEGVEPPPPGLKGRRATVTPRPRLRSTAGRAFDLVHRASPQWSGRPGSNRRSPAPKAGGLPLSYIPIDPFVGWVSAAPPTNRRLALEGCAALTHPTNYRNHRT